MLGVEAVERGLLLSEHQASFDGTGEVHLGRVRIRTVGILCSTQEEAAFKLTDK